MTTTNAQERMLVHLMRNGSAGDLAYNGRDLITLEALRKRGLVTGMDTLTAKGYRIAKAMEYTVDMRKA